VRARQFLAHHLQHPDEYRCCYCYNFTENYFFKFSEEKQKTLFFEKFWSKKFSKVSPHLTFSKTKSKKCMGKFPNVWDPVSRNELRTFHFFTIHFFDFVFEKVRWGDTFENFLDQNFSKNKVFCFFFIFLLNGETDNNEHDG
jgi:hypothetical protein